MKVYKVVMRPEGKNPGLLKKAADMVGVGSSQANENTGGIVLYLEDSNGNREEVSRVAYIRRVSKNPGVSFKDQLRKERKKAEAAVDELNAMLSGAGELA